jgi:translation initiation factor 1 (eIF-1/SUI1)
VSHGNTDHKQQRSPGRKKEKTVTPVSGGDEKQDDVDEVAVLQHENLRCTSRCRIMSENA